MSKVYGIAITWALVLFVNSAVPYECTIDGLTEFLDSINLDRSLDLENEKQSEDPVTLITLHNTKGLEYNKVIITGLEEGVFPHAGKVGAELEEERRLFYVGITRAKDELYVTSAAKRCLYGSWQYMRPSPFLTDAREGFTVIGTSPFGFGGVYVRQSYFAGASDSGSSGNSQADIEKDELAEKWKKGTKIYNDDYGYGVVTASSYRDDEFVITVQFENSGIKKFMPKYQARKLMIVKD